MSGFLDRLAFTDTNTLKVKKTLQQHCRGREQLHSGMVCTEHSKRHSVLVRCKELERHGKESRDTEQFA